jgi:hypothetical protein
VEKPARKFTRGSKVCDERLAKELLLSLNGQIEIEGIATT